MPIKSIVSVTISVTSAVKPFRVFIINLLLIRIPLRIIVRICVENLMLGIPVDFDNLLKVSLS